MKVGDLVRWTLPETNERVSCIGLVLETYVHVEGGQAVREAKVLFDYGEDLVDMANCVLLSSEEEATSKETKSENR